jgi:ribosomal protein L11 methyltransferase
VIKITSSIPESSLDYIDGYLFEHAPSPWVVEIDKLTGGVVLTGYFATQCEMHNETLQVKDELKDILEFDFSNENLQDTDWKNSYKKHFKAWSYNGFHLVPLWLKDDYDIPTNNHALFLDPGMAFGTGNHESTRMCIEFMVDDTNSKICGDSFVDLGCGSGILSLSAHLLGFSKVLGFDNDEDAVRISSENASVNNLQNHVQFQVIDLNKMNPSLGKFDYVAANIQADILISNAEKILGLSKPNSVIILSGILTKEADEVCDCLKNLNPDSDIQINLKRMGDWTSFRIIKSDCS